MANEKRLIDANALIAEYDRVHVGPPGGARKLMEDAPAIDAISVVRCKDCMHKRRYHYKPPVCFCVLHETVKRENGFCDMGERKDNE